VRSSSGARRARFKSLHSTHANLLLSPGGLSDADIYRSAAKAALMALMPLVAP